MAKHVTVIGGGIVGVCAALALQRDGHDVVIVERDGPGENCSFGNAGIICGKDSAIPLPSPGVIRDVPGMLLDRDGALVIRWRYLLRVMPWLIGFLKSSTPERQMAGARAMYALLDGTTTAFDRITAGSASAGLIRKNGYMLVHTSDEAFEGEARERRILRELGCPVEELSPDELRQMEPSLSHDLRHATYYPEAYSTTDPYRLTRLLADDFTAAGGRIVLAEVTGIQHGGGRVTGLETTGGPLKVENLVVAAGAWSHRVAAMMGLKVLLDTERGYHIVFHGVKTGLTRSVIHADGHYGVNQLDEGLRFAGTVELAGIEAEPNYRRSDLLYERGRGLLRDFDPARATEVTRWMGRRPTMPDYLPTLGAAPGFSNTWFDFGHQHLGLSLAARSGFVVADLVAGRDPGLDLAPFKADRF
jgi:glycine/D-amino acid oxidase-like deaminating enzyme